jgi:hypothetical protein
MWLYFYKECCFLQKIMQYNKKDKKAIIYKLCVRLLFVLLKLHVNKISHKI